VPKILGIPIAIVIFVLILVPQIIEAVGRRLGMPRGPRRWAMIVLYLVIVVAVAAAALTLLTPGPEPSFR
jgi:heme A synthase